MNRVVVINAMCSRWPEEKTAGVEIWGINATFRVESRLDRVYYFDAEHLFAPDVISTLAQMGVPVYTRKHNPDIPSSVEFPVDEIIRFFNGHCYATSTVAWAIQHAIYEHCNGNPIDRLILSGMYHPRDSMEYLWALDCINYWVGIAIGHGMKVTSYGNTAIAKAMPWMSNKYGYIRNMHGDLAVNTLSAAYQACYQYPRKFMTADDEIAATEDYDGLIETRNQLTSMLNRVNHQLRELNGCES